MSHSITPHRVPNSELHREIAERISFANPEQPPTIILSIGTVRCGSKASLRVFAESGIISFSQPMKSILRAMFLGHTSCQTGWRIPDVKTIYIKETFGPFNYDECSFDPITILMAAYESQLRKSGLSSKAILSYTKLLLDRMHVIVMCREPLGVWLSNIATYGKVVKKVRESDLWYYTVTPDALFEYTIYAYKNVELVRQAAASLGVKLSHYPDEANQDASMAYSGLFHRLGLPVSPQVNGWTDRSTFGGMASNVVLFEEQETQVRSALFGEINATSEVFFRKRAAQPEHTLIEEELRSAGLFELYESWSKQYAIESDV